MRVSLSEITEKFDELISQKVTCEEISDWAAQRRRAEDDYALEYIPAEEEERIWGAILYLDGVDLQVDEQGNYLHSIEDFVEYRNELFGPL